jgi:hypothetical protein
MVGTHFSKCLQCKSLSLPVLAFSLFCWLERPVALIVHFYISRILGDQ